MTDFSVGLYGDDSFKGGVYNIISSFNVGFYKALKQENVDAKFMKECFSSDLMPNFSLAFNVFEVDQWESSLKANVAHIMWVVDSPFWHLPIIQKFQKYQNFVCFCVSPVDKNAMDYFFPDVPFMYVPHAFDPELWHPDNSEKEFDVVFMSSMADFDYEIQELKAKIPPSLFEMFMEMYEYAIRNPEIAFWEIYNTFSDVYGYSIQELSLYYIFFMKICYAVTYKRRIQLVQSLRDCNLKVWGSPLWEKYVEGNVEYMGSADLFESVDIVRKSKIVLHLQPMQTLFGLHERVINAAASKAFVIADHNPQIKLNFADTVAFYNSNCFEQLPDLVQYYLSNDEERLTKADMSRQLVLQNHTWANRAKFLKKMFLGN